MAILQISEPGESPVPHQIKFAAGIDLGTTNSLVATVKNKRTSVVVDNQGDAVLPSVVYYGKESIQLGKSALAQAIADPGSTLSSFKRWMGRRAEDLDDREGYIFEQLADSAVATVKTNAGPINAVQASSEILGVLATRAESYLGGQLSGVVITVPAYFDDAQRQATKDAATLAGLNVLRLINEPTAAAVAYGLDKQDDRYVAIYDLGGGTFDISILQLSEGVFEVLATGGNAALGGDDFDHAIAAWILDQAGVSRESLQLAELRRLLSDARAAKHQLSQADTATVELTAQGITWQGELSLDCMNALFLPLIEKTLQVCKHCLDDADLEPQDIADVVLVGGSTRVPLVHDSVQNLFGQSPKTDVDPDQVVAIGAAIQADVLVGNDRSNSFLLLDVLPLSLGLETMGGLVEKVIPRNTAIPAKMAQEFTTYKDGQTALAIHVLQGERERVEDCRSLARFELRGIPPMVAGAARIRVTFEVDANGMLAVSAEEETKGVRADISVSPSSGLKEDEIAAMLRASYTNAAEDRDVRMLVEQQVEANGLVEAVEAALLEDAELLDVEELATIELALEEVKGVASLTDVAAIRLAVQKLSRKTDAFAAKRMDKSIKSALQGKSLEDISDSI